MPPGWALFSEPDFDLRFVYPRKVSGGEPPSLEMQPRPGGRSVRVTTPDMRAVYVEIRQASAREATESLRVLKEGLSARFDDAKFDKVETGTIAEMAAIAITFRFADRVRTALFTRQSAPSYAVVYDPRSVLNELIVASIELADPER